MKIQTSNVVFRADLYPRIEHSQQKAQEYAECIEHLPPIKVNQHNELIDGFHRWTAHKLASVPEIAVEVIQTTSDAHLLELAIETNAAHGLQMSAADKKQMAIKLYAGGTVRGKERRKELSGLLKVSEKTIERAVSDLDQAEREERKRRILDMWQRAHTTEEIGAAVGVDQATAHREVNAIKTDVQNALTFPTDFAPPIYNVWTFGKLTNEVEHFGNTEVRIVDNLLWLYTKPGDIVVDPFAGGGSTLDACRKRGRRCFISDRKPKPGLDAVIRTHDVCKSAPPLNSRWPDVSLVYLDPPYWRQAAGKYSDDADDLANMTLEQFTGHMRGIVNEFAQKMAKNGGIIALIIQPTQWKADPKGSFADHVFDIIAGCRGRNIIVENRVSCPYSTEQCTPQMVNWAKENKKLLVLSRELVIFRVLPNSP